MNAESNISVQPIALSEIDGEPRVRDVDIGERLGLARPRKIRDLIERNLAEIEAFGPAPRRGALATRSQGGGAETHEFWLNEEQALLVAILSDASKAAAVRAMLIRTFVDWRRGHLVRPSQAGPRDVHIAFRSFHSISRLIGLDANESALSANRATIKVTGFDALNAIGATHLIAARQEELLTPTIIGKRLGGLSAQLVNKRLEALGYQECGVDSHNAKTWHPTEKGEPFGKWFDTSKRHQDGASVLQWKWYASIMPELQSGVVVELVKSAQPAAG